MKPRLISCLLALVALGIFAWVVRGLDWPLITKHMAVLGVVGIFLVVGMHAVAFFADVGGWQLTFPQLPATMRQHPLRWYGHLWLVNAVGEGVSVAMPFGAFGGEPVKAWLLKSRFGIGYREATASLLVHQTLIAAAEGLFVLVGVVFLLRTDLLPSPVEWAIAWAAGILIVFMIGVIWVLRSRGLRWIITWVHRTRWGDRLTRVLEAAHSVETQMAEFMIGRPAQFWANIVLSFLAWSGGAFEIWIVMKLLGVSITVTDAWIVETVVVLVRSATFFVPGHLGAQDGAITALMTAIGATSEIGVVIALIRRVRELIWAGLGLAIGGWFGLKPVIPSHPPLAE